MLNTIVESFGSRIFTQKKLSALWIVLPIALLGIGIPTLKLGHLPLAKEECRLKKWNVPEKQQIKSTAQPLKIPPQSVLIARSPVGCCGDDISCFDTQLWGNNEQPADKKAMVTSIDHSLRYLQTDRAESDYKRYRVPGITRDRVTRSLQRFRQLLLESKSPQELNAKIAKEFVYYQSVGSNGKGGVLYTAYYEPLYNASRVPTPEYRYPIFKRPPDFDSWKRPHPTRLELEGADGLQGSKGKLKGLEIFWFRDRMEPFMIQIQGSARLQLTDGKQTSVGYAGSTRQDYVSIGRELANDGKLPIVGLTMPKITEYFHKHPEDLNVYLPRNHSFVFFKENFGGPAMGSITVPVTADRSIATDKSLMPPGALALIRADFPFPTPSGNMEFRVASRYVLDQDTGGAIKGAGRVDYFVGTGKIPGDRAGLTVGNGQLFYLLLK